MRSRYWLAMALVVLGALHLTHVIAEDLLPKSMSGRWSGVNQKKMPFDFAWSLQVARQNPGGSFEGTITYDGRQCRARNAPMAGTFNGSELVINTDLEPKAQCGPTTFRMKRTGGKHMFEGTMRAGPGVTGYLDPS